MKLQDRDLRFGALLLRLLIGLLLLVAGINKLIVYRDVVERISSGFAEAWIPEPLVVGFVMVLPIAEVLLGLLLTVGLWTRPALYLTGLLLIVLNFGLLARGDTAGAAKNVPYVIVIFLDTILLSYNTYSLDALLYKQRSVE